MNSKKRLIFILAGVVLIAALLVAYFVLISQEPKENKIETNQSYEESLYKSSMDNIISILVDTKEEAFEITQNKGEYYYKKNPRIVFDNIQVRNLWYCFSNFTTAMEVTDDPARKGEYGFVGNEPSVTVTENSGKTVRFVMGAEAPGGQSYFMIDGIEKIYLMSADRTEFFKKGLDLYRKTDLGSLPTSVQSMTVYSNGDKVMEVCLRKKDQADKSGSITKYRMLFPYTTLASAENVLDLLESFGAVTVKDFVEDSKTNLKNYGLLPGKARLKLVEQDGSIHELTFGNMDKDGYIYATYNDYNMVFTMNTDIYDAIKNITPFYYAEKFVNIYNLEDVSKIAVMDGDNHYTLSVEDKEYKLNGTKVGENSFKKLYREIIGLTITAEADTIKKQNKVYEIVFTFTDGTTKKTVIYDYDERNYGVQLNDGGYFLILKKNVDDMADMLK